METYVLYLLTWYWTLDLGSGWESDTYVWKVTNWRSQITLFTSVGDLDKMRNEYGYEYEYGYNNFILVLNCRYETAEKLKIQDEWRMMKDDDFKLLRGFDDGRTIFVNVESPSKVRTKKRNIFWVLDPPHPLQK